MCAIEHWLVIQWAIALTAPVVCFNTTARSFILCVWRYVFVWLRLRLLWRRSRKYSFFVSYWRRNYMKITTTARALGCMARQYFCWWWWRVLSFLSERHWLQWNLCVYVCVLCILYMHNDRWHNCFVNTRVLPWSFYSVLFLFVSSICEWIFLCLWLGMTRSLRRCVEFSVRFQANSNLGWSIIVIRTGSPNQI